MALRRRVIGLSSDGKLALKSANGSEERIREPQPLGVAMLLIDCSGSMEGRKLDWACDGAEDFSRSALERRYKVGVVRFDHAAEVLAEPTRDAEAISAALQRLKAGSTTRMSLAIDLGAEQVTGSGARQKALVLVTDGVPDPDDRETTLRAASRASRKGIEVIAIGTDDADRDFLARIATSEDLAMMVEPQALREAISTASRLLPRAD